MLRQNCAWILLIAVFFAHPAAAMDSMKRDHGKAIYNYYCYQCHGYNGDARTLASTYLTPPPRNFFTADAVALTNQAMVGAVKNGRTGTAMVSFASVLSNEDIDDVVEYIRHAFMRKKVSKNKYHTKENGWADHERFRSAFPFATGEIYLDTPWEKLTPDQRRGKRLFLGSCISCHDRSWVTDEGVIWELQALSYPRNHYTHKEPVPVDAITGASPYLIHQRQPKTTNLSFSESEGAKLYKINCEFCHAADGTGKNWIGSFLQPHPRDLTGARTALLKGGELADIIRDGLPGTSMPAWRDVLSADQIHYIVTYVKKVFIQEPKQTSDQQKIEARVPEILTWERIVD